MGVEIDSEGARRKVLESMDVLCLDNCLHFIGVSLVKIQGTFKICAFHYAKFYLKNILNAE